MGSFGQETLEIVGGKLQVSADGSPKAKHGGVTVYWDAIPAHSADTTYEYEDLVKAGEKFIRYGTILCKIVGGAHEGKYVPFNTALGSISGASSLSTDRGECFIVNQSVHEYDRMSDHPEVIEGGRIFKKRLIVQDAGVSETQTVTLGAGNTGGTFTLTFDGQTTGNIAYNASAAAVQTALEALSNVAVGDVTVTGSAGGPYTVVFGGAFENTNVPAMTGTGSLTGGTNTVTIATVTTGPTLAVFEATFPLVTYVDETQ